MSARCTTCRDTDYIAAPAGNAWRRYFERQGWPRHVLVSCPACGGISGKANRRALAARLDARKLAGTFGPLTTKQHDEQAR